jgi:tetratricopeptide (TPR) repeat protein
VRFNYAVALASVGRNGAAIRQLREVLVRRPDHGRAVYNLASLVQREGKLTEALSLWRRVTELNDKLAGAWFQRGTVAVDLRRYDEARESFEQVTTLEPNDAEAHHNLGLAWLSLERKDKAIAAFDRASALDPTFAAAAERRDALRTEFETAP